MDDGGGAGWVYVFFAKKLGRCNRWYGTYRVFLGVSLASLFRPSTYPPRPTKSIIQDPEFFMREPF